MGMAASQARLLTITARMHDVEYKAQAIQNAKLQLATQSDQVYKDYLEALDSSTLTVTDMNKQTVIANFNNLFGRKAVETGCKYALRENNSNKLLVSDDIKEGYEQFREDGGYDPCAFAMYMLFGDDVTPNNLEECENEVYEKHANEKPDDIKSMKAIQEKMKKLLDDNGVKDRNDLDEDKKDEYDELELAFKNKLYKRFGAEIYAKYYEEEGIEEDDFNQEDFNYYVSIFKQIQVAGGCESISDYDGPNGDASSDSDFLKNMLQCGKFSVEIVNEDKNGVVTLSGTSPDSDTYLGYTTTSTIDKAALAKAEAKYEHDSKEIDQKDKKFDLELSKLETERQALDTEYKSVQKVIQENIERTFGIFS